MCGGLVGFRLLRKQVISVKSSLKAADCVQSIIFHTVFSGGN